MSLILFCPFGHRLQVPARRAGDTIRCPVCRTELVVPEASHPTAQMARQLLSTAFGHSLPSRHLQDQAFQFGVLLGTVALFSVLPAAWEWVALAQVKNGVSPPPWVYLSLLGGLLIAAYGVFVAQCPDWSAFSVATGVLLALAALYAALLATAWLGNNESPLVALLQFGDKLAGRRAALWCFCMLGLYSLAGYFVGQAAVQSYNAYRRSRKVTPVGE